MTSMTGMTPAMLAMLFRCYYDPEYCNTILMSSGEDVIGTRRALVFNELIFISVGDDSKTLSLTGKGLTYVDGLLRVPLPELTWTMKGATT